MAVNKGVVIGALGITAFSSVRAISQGQGITKIAIGGYLLAIIGSIIDLIPGAGTLAGSIVMVAFLGVLLTDLPPLLGLGNKALTSSATTAATPGAGGGGGGGGVR